MRGSIFFVFTSLALGSSDCAASVDEQDSASLLQTRGFKRAHEVDNPHGRVYRDNHQVDLGRQVQHVTARVATTAVNGILEFARYSQRRVCVAATHEEVTDPETGETRTNYYEPEWTLEEPLCFKKIQILYLSGNVSCRSAASGDSHFGCDRDLIGLVLAKKNAADEYDVVFPKPVRATQGEGESGCDGNANCQWNVNNIDGYSFGGYNSGDWYRIESYTARSTHPVLNLNLNPEGDGGVFLTKGTYRLWFHEDLTGATEHDNSGVACYNLDFELCQGTPDAERTGFSAE